MLSPHVTLSLAFLARDAEAGADIFGMALGGWMSGVIFDLTGSYRAAFVNGILFNLVNVSIALFLLRRATVRAAFAARSAPL